MHKYAFHPLFTVYSLQCTVCDQVYYVTFTDFCRVIHKRKHTRSQYRNLHSWVMQLSAPFQELNSGKPSSFSGPLSVKSRKQPDSQIVFQWNKILLGHPKNLDYSNSNSSLNKYPFLCKTALQDSEYSDKKIPLFVTRFLLYDIVLLCDLELLCSFTQTFTHNTMQTWLAMKTE